MKKHIKKRLLFEFKLTAQLKKAMEENGAGIPVEVMPRMKKFPKDLTSFLITDTDTVIQAFPYLYQGQIRFVPEPDPVLVYFHSAYLNFRQIDEKKKAILKGLLEPHIGEIMTNELYEYFGLTSGFVIFLFTSMEAFINRSIPIDFVYSKVDAKKTEIYNKQQIEEFVPFLDKMKIILPLAIGKDFSRSFPLKYQQIINLKEYRDSIVHTKASNKGHTPYDYLYKKALEFKYGSTINAVADFCNFYHKDPNYITECPCNMDW